MVTRSNDNTARLWDAQSGQELRQFVGHADQVFNVAFSPDGTRILTSGGDKIVQLWNTRTGQEVRQFIAHTDVVHSVAFSPDGKHILSGSWDTTARLWRIDYNDVIRFACAQLPRDFTDEERALYNIPDNDPTCPQP